MSIHKSLKGAGALSKHRNVLTRLERIGKLETDELWTEEKNSMFNLPKVISRKLIGKKKAKKEEETADGAAPAASTASASAPAASSAAAPAAKPAGKAKK